jgi:hypothetical protein
MLPGDRLEIGMGGGGIYLQWIGWSVVVGGGRGGYSQRTFQIYSGGGGGGGLRTPVGCLELGSGGRVKIPLD